MVKTRQLFIMVSRTDTHIGRLIRNVSHYPYNHVSLTLDPSLRHWYSFARYVQDAPFYSGLVQEPVERFFGESPDVPVRIYRLEIPLYNADRLEALLKNAGHPESGMVYNYFDAVVSTLGWHLPVPGAHTCLSFACTVLEQQHLSIQSLCESLEPHLIYEGPLASLVPDSGRRNDPYFSGVGLLRGTGHSARQFCILTHRVIAHGFDIYRAHKSRRTIR